MRDNDAHIDCGHGAPDFDSREEEELYEEGLGGLLHNVNKYIEKGSNSVGKKAAEKLKKESPQLVSLEMLHLLASVGTKMWLVGEAREYLVIQALAEVIGKLEEELKGYSTSKRELNKSFNESSGLKEASPKRLKKFLNARIPCQCLQPPKENEEEMGRCCFADCGKRKSLDSLQTCAGCGSVLYCSVKCQRSDWAFHSEECQSLARARKKRLAAAHAQGISSDVGKAQEDDDGDDEGSLAPVDLLDEKDSDIGNTSSIRNGGSAESFGFEDLIGEIEDLLGESDAHLALPSQVKAKEKRSKPRQRSAEVSKLHASTSFVPSQVELEKERKKKSSSPLFRKSFDDGKGRFLLSASFSSMGAEKKRRRKKEALV